MPRKPAHQQFDTLKAIQDEAFLLFGRFGYEGVSIGDISRAAKLSKGALYWHYSGKAALYLDCLGRLHGLFRRYIFDPMDAAEDPVTGVILMFRGQEQLVRDPGIEAGIGGYWVIPSTAETAPMLEAQRAFEAASALTIGRVLRRGIEQGRFDLAGDLEDISSAIIALTEAVILPLRYKSSDEVHRMLAVLARTLFRAYAKGEEMLKLARLF